MLEFKLFDLPDDPAATDRYAGPERRANAGAHADHWKAALDEIDFGILLLDGAGRALHINHAARVELDDRHPLQLRDSELRCRRPRDNDALRQALDAAARRGFRRQLLIGSDPDSAVISVVPLCVRPTGPLVLVMLAKRRSRHALTVQSFAAIHGLSPAESGVLGKLCDGASPGRIASQSGLAISTIRTHIANIRAKTGASTIRELLQRVVALPPLMSVLRERPPAHGESNHHGD